MDYKIFIESLERRPFIIAEAGVNHDGDPHKAKRLIDVAVGAGCDAVKFQTFITEKIVSKTRSIKPDYQHESTDESDTEFETIKKLELAHHIFADLKKYCDDRGIIFLSTPDEADSADYLDGIGTEMFKIGSHDVTNLPYLGHVASKGKPIILSSGASTIAEVTKAVETVEAINPKIVLLHCVSQYPAPTPQLNLRVIEVYRRLFRFPVGFSDHSLGIEAACAALALGARVFEKHFTLDKTAKGPDHQASLDPGELKRYVATLHDLDEGLGDGIKRVMPCEENTRLAIRRFLVAAKDLPRGSSLNLADLLFLRIGRGISPEYFDLVENAALTRDVKADEPISWEMLRINAKSAL